MAFIRSILFDQPVNDIDFFITNPENIEAVTLETIKNIKKYYETIYENISCILIDKTNTNVLEFLVTEKVDNFDEIFPETKIYAKIQFIQTKFESHQQVIDAFDLNLCKVYYDGENVFMTEQCAISFKYVINYSNISNRRSNGKYYSYGFSMYLKNNVENVADITEPKPLYGNGSGKLYNSVGSCDLNNLFGIIKFVKNINCSEEQNKIYVKFFDNTLNFDGVKLLTPLNNVIKNDESDDKPISYNYKDDEEEEEYEDEEEEEYEDEDEEDDEDIHQDRKKGYKKTIEAIKTQPDKKIAKTPTFKYNKFVVVNESESESDDEILKTKFPRKMVAKSGCDDEILKNKFPQKTVGKSKCVLKCDSESCEEDSENEMPRGQKTKFPIVKKETSYPIIKKK